MPQILRFLLFSCILLMIRKNEVLQVCCKFFKKSRSLELNTELKYCSVLKLMRSSELFSYLLRATTSIANVSSTPKFEGAKKREGKE